MKFEKPLSGSGAVSPEHADLARRFAERRVREEAQRLTGHTNPIMVARVAKLFRGLSAGFHSRGIPGSMARPGDARDTQFAQADARERLESLQDRYHESPTSLSFEALAKLGVDLGAEAVRK